MGSADQAAISELSASAEANRWTQSRALQLVGQVDYPPEQEKFPFTLLLTPHGLGRLENTGKDGTTVDIINGLHEVTISPDHKKRGMSPEYALSGLAALSLCSEVSRLKTADIADQGISVVDGKRLHKVTLTVLPHPGKPETLLMNRRYAVDLYFDPETHLLAKAAARVPLPGESIPVALRVTSFDAYSAIAGSMVPASITDTVNGQVIAHYSITTAAPVNQLAADRFSY